MGTHHNGGSDRDGVPNHRARIAHTALRTLVARIESLPASDSDGFVTAAGRVLHELRKLDVTISAAAEFGGPAPVLALSAIRRTYTALLSRVAQSPHATLGQRLAASRHRAELTAFEAAGACGVALEVIVGVEARLPVPEDAAAALQGLVDQLDQVTAVA
ncbi:hypothetical protein [Mycolicibacterium sp. NCC-Tsukiji]|uniref:hypothetical protein n=1 Tax=Mycolicibacterium sp. NCC-Tsukiji TaxID=2185272 RepID=UPI000ECDE806|nr:hypothetical protein [Mycolicibacterium sp. NCC-Tsukiji]GCA99336.1 hypothetical protein NCCNTM_29710 [Mycolicibacterium sp. NCC-Tsukiji]